jgi:hypothetical protein
MSLGGPMTSLFSSSAVICSSLSVLPSILSEACIVLIWFCLRSVGDGFSRYFALI